MWEVQQVRVAVEAQRRGQLGVSGLGCEARQVECPSGDVESVRLRMRDHERMSRFREVIGVLRGRLSGGHSG